MEHVTISVSRALLEQLSGVKKPAAEEKKKSTGPRTKWDRDTVSYVKENEKIRAALNRSRKLNKLLLKREDEELKKIDALAQELLQHKAMQPPSRDACHDHREAVEACCQAHPTGLGECGTLIDAYATCANRSFMQRVTKTTVQQSN